MKEYKLVAGDIDKSLIFFNFKFYWLPICL